MVGSVIPGMLALNESNEGGLSDSYEPKIELYIEYWQKASWRQANAIELKQKFYEDHSLRAVNICENDLLLADRIIPARTREVMSRWKFKNLLETRTGSKIGTQLTAEENIEKEVRGIS